MGRADSQEQAEDDSPRGHEAATSRGRLGGTLFFLAGLQWVILVTIAEVTFPDYSVKMNDLSDLASTVPPNASVVQPSATLFDSAMIAVGLMVIAATYLASSSYQSLALSSLLGVFGVGCTLVGVFPGDTGAIHATVSLVAFIFGPLSAMASYRVQNAPLKYVFMALGVVALVPLFSRVVLGDGSPILAILGRGGEERLIAYPVLAWIMGFGASLVGVAQDARSVVGMPSVKAGSSDRSVR